jgi:hypothetical protein
MVGQVNSYFCICQPVITDGCAHMRQKLITGRWKGWQRPIVPWDDLLVLVCSISAYRMRHVVDEEDLLHSVYTTTPLTSRSWESRLKCAFLSMQLSAMRS